MKQALAFLGAIFCTGIFVEKNIGIPFVWIYLLAWIFLIFCIILRKENISFEIQLALLFFLIAGAWLKCYQTLPANHIHTLIHYQAQDDYIVRGLIVNEPVERNTRNCFIFKAEAIETRAGAFKCCGQILVYFSGRQNITYGDELLLGGNIYRPFSRSPKQKKDYREYLYNQGIFYLMNVKNDLYLKRLNKNKGWRIKLLALELKNNIAAIISRYTCPVTSGILQAMVLGEKKDVSPFIYNTMMKTGTVHILVVSGSNVGIVVFIVMLVLKFLRIRRKARLVLAIPVIFLYCLMTGATNPVLRATLMAVVFLLAYFLKRDADIYNSLSLAAIFILSLNPLQLFDIGFQLSFSSVLAIVIIYPRLKSFLQVELIKNRFLVFLIDGCLISFAAWLGTLGLIAYYFNNFAPITVFANIIIVPLAGLITISGFILTGASLFSHPLARIFALACEFLVLLLLHANQFLVNLPGAYIHF
jgi:competence protein ComEC